MNTPKELRRGQPIKGRELTATEFYLGLLEKWDSLGSDPTEAF